MATSEWLAELGNVCLSCVFSGVVGDRNVRHVVFDGPVMVDFAVVSSIETRWGGPILRLLASKPAAIRFLPAGLRTQVVSWFEQQRKGSPIVLVDKGGAASRLRVARAPEVAWRPPAEGEFKEAVNAFWSLAMWVAKSAGRRELWTANWVAAHQLQEQLLCMMEWQARAQHGRRHDTWFSGRFIGKWADPRAVAALPQVFARYDADDVWRALFAAMELYGWLARETAERLGFAYPADAEARVSAWLRLWHAKGRDSVIAMT
jgi:hypothetical protein